MLARGQYNDALSHYHAAVGELIVSISLLQSKLMSV